MQSYRFICMDYKTKSENKISTKNENEYEYDR